MTPKRTKIARHVLLLIAVTVLLSAVAIWFGVGPIVHSQRL